MSTYVMSDIHGEFDLFMELMEQIKLEKDDTLYVLGDVLDRGPQPVKALLKLMEMQNVVCLAGNHEVMAVSCLEFLLKEITDASIEELDDEMFHKLITWQCNGSETTIDEFRKLNRAARQKVIDYIKEFLIYKELTVNGMDYLLVHAGLGGFSPDKCMEDYSLRELVWEQADYGIKYFDDVYLVTGHTPTQTIEDNPKPGRVYRKKPYRD